MVSNSKLLKVIFITVQHFAMLLSPVTRAEEASVLATATVIGSDIKSSTCPDPSVLISGFYMTYCESDPNSPTAEFIIDL